MTLNQIIRRAIKDLKANGYNNAAQALRNIFRVR